METTNAQITTVELGIERSALTMWIHVEYDVGAQGYGGFVMDQYDEDLERRVGTKYGTECIRRLLDTFEVEEFRDLDGMPVRVQRDATGGRIKRVGHFLKDQWFSFSDIHDEQSGGGGVTRLSCSTCATRDTTPTHQR